MRTPQPLIASARLTDPEFLVSPAGRLARTAFGAMLVVGGRTIGGRMGTALVALGTVPMVTSALGYLAVGPLVGTDLRGRPRRSPLPRARLDPHHGDATSRTTYATSPGPAYGRATAVPEESHVPTRPASTVVLPAAGRPADG